MDDKQKLELADGQPDEVPAAVDEHAPSAAPPGICCVYRYMEYGKPCPCCCAGWEIQISG